jgi:hypothetical protein
MAKNSITDYSNTAASNTDIQSVDIDEGCLPSGINNAIREIMADLADVNDGTVSLTSPAFAAASLTGNLSFGDNNKAIFGAGSDLQIYHDGTHSYLLESNGAGNLYLGGDNLLLTNANATKVYVKGIDGGATELRHNNAQKLATTSTGIDVTGTVTADGLTVDGSSQTTSLLVNTGSAAWADANADDLIIRGVDVGITVSSSTTGRINFGDATSSTKQGQITYTHSGDNLDFYTATNKRLGIAGNGDISFYEDTGTTAKLFWDASAESLGIGTSSFGWAASGRGLVEINGSSSALYGAKVGNVKIGYLAATASVLELTAVANVPLTFLTNNTERMRITSAGRVGIATDSPNGKLDVSSGNNGNSGYVDLYIGGTDPSNARSGIIRKNTSSPYDMTIKASNYSAGNDLIFDTGAGEKMRIKDTGRVGIGELIPDGLLHLTGDTNSNGAELYLQVNNNNTTDNLGAIHFGNNVDSTLSKILSGTSGANNSSYLTFSTSSAGSQSERARLDSSGNLLVGKTATDSTTAGVDLRPEGVGVFVRDGNRPLIANRLTDDGDLIQFRKDGTTVGAIGSAAGVVSYHVLDPRSGGVGIMGTNLNNIIPTDGTGTPADNAKDLGLGSQRWRNLYLGGTAYISGGSNQITLDTGDQATYGRLDVGHFSNGAFIGTYAGTDAAANILRFGTSGSEHMRVTSAGLVGIGTSLPSKTVEVTSDSLSALKINGYSSSSGLPLYTYNDTAGAGFCTGDADSQSQGYANLMYLRDTDNSFSVYLGQAGAATHRMKLEADGDLHVDGNVVAYSTTVSDIRLKKDVAPIENAVTKVQQLNGCTFTYLKDDRKSAGLIAQDVEKVLPSAVIEDEAVFHGEEGETYKTVQYDQVIGLLVEAVKELKAEIEGLKDASNK